MTLPIDWDTTGPNEGGLYSSRDTARPDATWTLYSETPVEGTINALWADPEHSEILIAGTTNGLFWSRDGADPWNRVDLTDLNPS